MKLKYFDDHEVGSVETVGSYTAEKKEMMACAQKWDPQPFHVDEKVAESSIYGGITAPSIYTLAISNWLSHQFDSTMADLGLLGYDRMEFPNHVRPGDTLVMTSTITDKRASRTKSDRGIVRFRVIVSNQKDEPVLKYDVKTMLARRPE